jgi:hypothetical protein
MTTLPEPTEARAADKPLLRKDYSGRGMLFAEEQAAKLFKYESDATATLEPCGRPQEQPQQPQGEPQGPQQEDEENEDVGETSSGGGEARSGPETREHTQCRPLRKLGQWEDDEDALLLKAISRERERSPEGKIKWPLVASSVPQRSHKQCRERWVNHLSPTVIKHKWTSEEDALLLELGRKHLGKWAAIARFIPGRTENQVKVRWHILNRAEATEHPLLSSPLPLSPAQHRHHHHYHHQHQQQQQQEQQHQQQQEQQEQQHQDQQDQQHRSQHRQQQQQQQQHDDHHHHHHHHHQKQQLELKHQQQQQYLERKFLMLVPTPRLELQARPLTSSQLAPVQQTMLVQERVVQVYQSAEQCERAYAGLRQERKELLQQRQEAAQGPGFASPAPVPAPQNVDREPAELDEEAVLASPISVLSDELLGIGRLGLEHRNADLDVAWSELCTARSNSASKITLPPRSSSGCRSTRSSGGRDIGSIDSATGWVLGLPTSRVAQLLSDLLGQPSKAKVACRPR